MLLPASPVVPSPARPTRTRLAVQALFLASVLGGLAPAALAQGPGLARVGPLDPATGFPL